MTLCLAETLLKNCFQNSGKVNQVCRTGIGKQAPFADFDSSGRYRLTGSKLAHQDKPQGTAGAVAGSAPRRSSPQAPEVAGSERHLSHSRSLRGFYKALLRGVCRTGVRESCLSSGQFAEKACFFFGVHARFDDRLGLGLRVRA